MLDFDRVKLLWKAHCKLVKSNIIPNSPDDIRFITLSLAGEIGEVCNIVKKEWRGDNIAVKQKLEDELADVYHYFLMLLYALQIDIQKASDAKIEVLKQRWPEIFN